MTIRKLVSIKQIKDIQPIKGADRIVKAMVGGWPVVVKKDEFQVGDYGVYFEIDSFMPASDERFSFVQKDKLKTFNDVEGTRLSTIKLKKQISQGLVLSISEFPEIEDFLRVNNKTVEEASQEKLDFSELLGIQKYEMDDTSGATEAAGLFPYWIHKTDQERLQSFYDEIAEKEKETEFYATMKLDGSSATFCYTTNPDLLHDKLEKDSEGGQFFVCSRNLLLKRLEDNAFFKASQNQGIENKLAYFHKKTGRTIAIQGELVGPGIQQNYEKFNKFSVLIFSIYDVDDQRYLPMSDVIDIATELELPTVPVLEVFKPFERFKNIDEFMEYSDNLKPTHASIPEGVVYHAVNGNVSFKVISNKYLLKTGK